MQLQSITPAYKQYHSLHGVSSLSSKYDAEPRDAAMQQAVEQRKLVLMRSYIEFAAREISTKTMQWRNGDSTTLVDDYGSSSDGFAGSRSKTKHNSFTSLDYSAIPIPDHSLHSFLVPHQKMGALVCKPLSEDTRRQAVLMEADGAMNLAKMRSLFGLQEKHDEVGRSVGGLLGPWDQNDGESVVGSTPLTTAAYSESISVLKRLNALEIPSLPPDTGSLMQPTGDNSIYRLDFERLPSPIMGLIDRM